MLKAACPEAFFLLTTPPGAYVGRRRARTINPRTVTAARIIKEYAQEHKMAVCDMYNIVAVSYTHLMYMSTKTVRFPIIK